MGKLENSSFPSPLLALLHPSMLPTSSGETPNTLMGTQLCRGNCQSWGAAPCPSRHPGAPAAPQGPCCQNPRAVCTAWAGWCPCPQPSPGCHCREGSPTWHQSCSTSAKTGKEMPKRLNQCDSSLLACRDLPGLRGNTCAHCPSPGQPGTTERETREPQ